MEKKPKSIETIPANELPFSKAKTPATQIDSQKEPEAKVTESPNEIPFQFDEYWLTRGKQFADGTLSSLSKTMQLYIKILNGLIATSFLTSVGLITYLKSPNIFVFLAFIIPVVVIIWMRYRIGTEDSKPIYNSPDLRSPIQINKAFNDIVNDKRVQLTAARDSLGIAVGVFCFCIPIGIYSHNRSMNASIKDYVFADVTEKTVTIEGKLPKATNVQLLILGTSVDEPRVNREIRTNVLLNKNDAFDIGYTSEQLKLKPRAITLSYDYDGKPKFYTITNQKVVKKVVVDSSKLKLNVKMADSLTPVK